MKAGNKSDLTFTGVDVSLEISLFEYGILVSNEEHDDGSGTHFVVYKINDDAFGTGHISEKEVDGYVEGKEFMDKKDIKSFLNYVGMNKKEWKELNLVNKLHDLMSYWGLENIMGTDYYPWTKEFAEREILEKEVPMK